MSFEQQTPELAELIGKYWGYIVGFFSALGLIYGAWRRYVKKRISGARTWWKDAVALPTTLLEIKNELQFENGMSLRQRVIRIGEDLMELRRVVASETAARRSLLQTIDSPMFECNERGQLLWANQDFLRVTQKNISQILGSNWRNIIALPDREEFIEGWHRAITEGTDFSTKFRLSLPDGEEWMFFEVVCNKDDLGNVISYLGRMRPAKDPRIHATDA